MPDPDLSEGTGSPWEAEDSPAERGCAVFVPRRGRLTAMQGVIVPWARAVGNFSRERAGFL